jgi:hypothetical protein
LYVTAQGQTPGIQNFRSPDFTCIQNRENIKCVTNSVDKFRALGLIEMFILGGLANADIIATVLGAR